MIMEHSTSGVKRTVLGPVHILWCFLFGWIYYACKGMWGCAIVSFFTINGLLIVFPVMNKSLVQKHYENKGWKVVT